MTVGTLTDGQTVRYRAGRYRDDMDRPDWEPWTEGMIYVQRDGKGQVCVLALKDRLDWAEYDPRHSPPENSTLEAGGYYLEIEGLTP
jgi:hypothetical protein